MVLKRQTTIPSDANTNDWTSSIVAPAVEMRRGAVVARISFSAFTSESFCEKKKWLNEILNPGHSLRADVNKYRPEVYKSEKSKIPKKIDKVARGKLLTY